MSEKKPHCAIKAELIRRGGRGNRPPLILPGDVDGVADKLRGNNQRHQGVQPLVPPKAWWRKYTGSLSSTNPPTDLPKIPKAWKSTMRALDWDALPASMAETRRSTAHLAGEDKRARVEVASRMPAGGEPRAQHATGDAELKRHLGNPDAPRHPDDLQNCDLAATEERFLQVVYADDHRADQGLGGNAAPGNANLLKTQQKNRLRAAAGIGADAPLAHVTPVRGKCRTTI